jgi:hypothetical protein
MTVKAAEPPIFINIGHQWHLIEGQPELLPVVHFRRFGQDKWQTLAFNTSAEAIAFADTCESPNITREIDWFLTHAPAEGR